ncbi:hypothetical protein A0H81_04426 [Grifola frondosa]|uniref:Uncharacterized protein n=1 Tax=Grifola frondosa TaxID=5627 RepID=A0A1C7ME91_GRIFR|nr:hypothetical protein A0H81_04426 [Grifola frondosa]
MSRFRPLRASSPLRPSAGPAAVLPNDILDQSHSTPVAIPELVGLTPEEVDFIEEVIERAPATATTFLLVFKAYNDILKERGLDPHNEVVYYNRLLKLGTLKGKNVGEKWAMVKAQQGYVVGRGKKGGRTTRVTRATPISSRTVKRPPPAPRNTQQGQESDAFTLHSHQDETDTSEAEQPTETAITAAQYHHTPRPLRRLLTPTPTITSTNSLGLDTGPPSTISYHPLPTHANPIRIRNPSTL